MAPEYIERFSATERAVHWVHATAFLVLLATGLALYVPALSVAVGRRPLLKDIHVYTAVSWIAALVLVVVLGDRRRLRATVRELETFDADDMLWLRRYPRPQGRFNAGQKVNAALTAAFAVLFTVSGSLLWLGERDHRFQLASTILLHDWLTLISLFLLVGHLYLALIYPATRHALRGMTVGTVRRDWAERHHPKWVREQRQ
ncbi:MAG TPA: cytochrome b/b6 domain-containing protein [Gaiellaceae bacterium]|jgi:formate dehydrogenase subunit gamma|nr:cytochrome b/b6 domain-containing protein [Gaiellaceae bacterium]